MSLAIALHVLSVVVWVGGMFFAYMALRPAAVEVLEPPLRLQLWVATFKRFFPWVWLAIVLILGSGYWMIFKFGGFGNLPLYIHVMNGLGLLMMAIYLHVFFVPFQRLRKAVSAEIWADGGKHLGQIRMLVGTNTILGLLTIAIATGGRYLIH
ncbi:MAG: CopD family protein [Gammaproteobacteria bacterium]|nr:CopD family protein [Gammaproteobacteria bacterium]